MGFRINANRVRVRHGKCSLQNQGLSILAKNGHIAGFCRDIQPMESRVEREYVRVFSYWYVASTCMLVRSTTASLLLSSPATKASLAVMSRAIPCGLSIPVTA